MRFEQLNYKEQERSLKRLHRFLNQYCFDNELQDIEINVENLCKCGLDNYACYFTKTIIEMPNSNKWEWGQKISFSNKLIDYMAKAKTQRDQAYIAGVVMLHEMIHQYFFENGMENKNHDGDWAETAEEFGLISIYNDGVQVEEYLSEFVSYMLRHHFRL